MSTNYVKRGKMTQSVNEAIINRLSEMAEAIGQDLLKYINPDCDLGNKIGKKDKVSFKVEAKNGKQSYGWDLDYRAFESSAFATAQLNGSKEVLYL